MNPYDFVPIDWQKKPKRQPPVWHHRLVSESGQPLYSGYMDIELEAETPIFIRDPKSDPYDAEYPATFIRNAQGDYIIPGSSFKGMLRCLVETLGNGCLTLFDETYEPEWKYEQVQGRGGGRGQRRQVYNVHYQRMIEPEFRRCDNHMDLCIACRIFGMLSQARGGGVFLGKINIGDAVAPADDVYEYEWDSIYTLILAEPKPHHSAFYLEQVGNREYIAGRKYYFHHKNEPLVGEDNLRQSSHDAYMNQHIAPLDYGSRFYFRVDFTNLEAAEFAALMLAITLQPTMRHKIGYGKPIGLGTVHLTPSRLTLVDYSKRYVQRNAQRGITTWEGDSLQQLLNSHMQALHVDIARYMQDYLARDAMKALQRIWLWPPENGVEYFYPDKKNWFDKPASRGKRIKDTRYIK